jgi:hypothetical protein
MYITMQYLRSTSYSDLNAVHDVAHAATNPAQMTLLVKEMHELAAYKLVYVLSLLGTFPFVLLVWRCPCSLCLDLNYTSDR